MPGWGGAVSPGSYQTREVLQASRIYREDKHPSVVIKVITESKTFV